MHFQILLKGRPINLRLGLNYMTYRDNIDTSLDESLKLYANVRNISAKYVSLVIVKDHAHNTLNLAVSTKNRVAEMRLNLENISVPDMNHLHKQTGEVIYNDLLKATLKVSRMKSTKTKIRNQLRHERVENRAHQQEIKKLQGDLLTANSETNKGDATQKMLAKNKTQSNC